MSMVTDRELTVLRATQEATFDLSGVIKRNALVSDGAGGATATPTTVATVSCRVAPQVSLSGETVIGGRLQSQTQWLVTMPQGTPVKETDWIEIADVGTFDVVSVRGTRSYETARVCLCVKR